MRYAGFWRRFCAAVIDFFVLLPVFVLFTWLNSLSRTLALFAVVPVYAFFVGYSIYCHGRFGQTVGKWVMGIRVTCLDGSAIGWRKAWLRSSVDVVLQSFAAAAMLFALVAIADSQYYGVGWLERNKNLGDLKPEWLRWPEAAGEIWYWSEVVVMLFNRKRRALHDFLAGTVVVIKPKAKV